MIRAFLSFTILLLTIIVVGCKSQRIDAPESVAIDGKVIYGPDGSPLTQLQHLIGVKWLFSRLDSFFMGVVGTTDFIDPVAGMSR